MSPRRGQRSAGDAGRAEGRPEHGEAPAGEAAAGDPVPAGPDAELLDLIDHLGTLLERSELAELQVEAGATAILLRRAEAPSAPGAGGSPTSTDPGGHAPTTPAPPGPEGPRIHPVLAPLTGIFYAAPTPEAPPFVAVGVEVVIGQVIGLIEAMKLFNEIKSDITGRVQRVVAESGQLVKAKDPLIEVAPSA